ncbi:TIGR03943 family protein [Hassallia byssoidea VB512170]|uniref:TIGR03943 family protein n=1 Tax=Hassallia byssoidea VB512170 TaxID=1304833 RepID=A0A846H3W1_9CYAN|nr:TIGR03943 family protein [Hassalia byssoidea]NEU71803.1 TIGR03943 family protein [Hassalia byssoidea VB512170]
MTKKSPHFFKFSHFLDWLDVFGITAWAVLLLKYWLTEKLVLLVHPKYFWLVITNGFLLLFVALFKAWGLWRKHPTLPKTQHLSLFPPGWGSGLLLVIALLGLVISPQPLTSQAATQQEVTDFSIATSRVKPQAFRASTRPEDRSLVDWVKTLTTYAEPDSYIGQKAKVQGFVIHLKSLPDDFLMITRFVITHCAIDATPMGLPVKLTTSRQAYPPDTWLEIEGEMMTAELEGKRELTIQAKSIKPIPAPKNPYEY